MIGFLFALMGCADHTISSEFEGGDPFADASDEWNPWLGDSAPEFDAAPICLPDAGACPVDAPDAMSACSFDGLLSTATRRGRPAIPCSFAL